MLKFATPYAKPPWKKNGKKLESIVRKALYDFHLAEDPKIAIALSGGKDSLTLLFLLHAISGKGFPPFELLAVHIGGEFSCGAGISETFLKHICNNLNVPLIIETSRQKKENLECYSCSRERRTLLFNAAKNRGFKTIAFGHHSDDNAQTLLMNLLHKAEFAGLLPKIKMHKQDVTIIRPLIYAKEQDIKQFAKEYGFARITCQCPVGADSMRKKVDKLLEHIEELFPNARANVSQGALLYGSHKAGTPS